MKYFTPTQFKTAFNALPEVVQDIVYAEDTREKMYGAFLVCNVPEDKKEDLAYLFDTVLYGLLSEEEAKVEVQSILACTPSAGEQVVARVHEVLFKDIAELLRKAHEHMPQEALAYSTTPPPAPTVETPKETSAPKSSESLTVSAPTPQSVLTPFLEKQAVQERCKKLPPPVQEVIYSPALGEVFRTVSEKYALSEPQKAVLGTEAVSVLVGAQTVQAFREHMAKESELSAQVLENVLAEIEQGMFRPVRTAILAVLEHAGEKKESGEVLS